MKRLLRQGIFLIAYTILFTSLKAQQHGISGTIVDKTGKPVYEAKVLLLSFPTATVLKETSSSSKGTFTIGMIDTGKYTIRIMHPSYADNISDITIADTDIIIDKIVLSPGIINLNGVVVQSKKPLIEQKIDRTVYNVENQVSLAGATALDAIGKLPGVRVIGGNGIALLGKGQVNVLLDDRLIRLSGDDLINMLRSMPAAEIVRIEVIPNPPAKYDAAGNFGLINIVTRKKRNRGLSGNIYGAYSQAVYGSMNGGGTLNFNSGKWNIDAAINGIDNIYYELTNPTTDYPSQIWRQSRTSKNITKAISPRIGIDYQISKRQLLGVSYAYNNKRLEQDEYSQTRIFSAGNKIDSLIRVPNDIERKTQSHDLNLHYENRFDSIGRKLSVDAGYFTLDNKLNQLSNSSSYLTDNTLLSESILKSAAPQNLKAYTLQTDLTLPGKFMNFGAGAKVAIIKTESSSTYYRQHEDIFYYDSSLSNVFNYKENVEAAYVNADKEFGKWGMQLGLRAEYTQTTGYSATYNQTTKRDYLKLFPTVFIIYKKDADNNFVFSFGKRINRPNYWYLNPFRQFVSPYFYYEGNPFLQPSYANNFELTYSHKSIFITKAFVSIQNNIFDQIMFADSVTRINRLTRMNYYSQRNFGLSESVNIISIPWMESYNTVSVYYIRTKSMVDYTKDKEGWGGDVSSSNVFYLNKLKTFSAGLDFAYTFPQLSGINKFSAYYSVDMGFRWLTMKKRLTIGLTATDIFRTSKTKFYGITNNIKTSYDNYFDNRAVRVSLNYKFGKNTKNKQPAKQSNSDEKKRANF